MFIWSNFRGAVDKSFLPTCNSEVFVNFFAGSETGLSSVWLLWRELALLAETSLTPERSTFTSMNLEKFTLLQGDSFLLFFEASETEFLPRSDRAKRAKRRSSMCLVVSSSTTKGWEGSHAPAQFVFFGWPY